MKFWIIRVVNIGLLTAFLLTFISTFFMKIHFFRETHEFFGAITFILVFAHIFIYRKGLKAMFKFKNKQ